MNLVKCKSKISSFRNQLELYGKMFLNNQFSQFASLENLKLQISKGEVEIFSSYLEQLKDDIDKRFNDVFQLNVPKWIIIIIIVSLLSHEGPRHQNLGHLNRKTHNTNINQN